MTKFINFIFAFTIFIITGCGISPNLNDTNGNEGANTGYKITTSADTYNRQLHQREIDFINSMADDYAAKNNISKEQAVKILYTAASVLVDKGSYHDFTSKEKFEVRDENDEISVINYNEKFYKFNRGDINNAKAYLLVNSKEKSFRDIYKEEFTKQDYFTATKEQYNNSGYTPDKSVGLEDGSLSFLPAPIFSKSAFGLFKNTALKNPLENISYTKKVLTQMSNKSDYFHSFPNAVDAFAKYGKKSEIIGKDGIKKVKIEIQGSYKNHDGVFEYIIEPDNTVNHRFFKIKEK